MTLPENLSSAIKKEKSPQGKVNCSLDLQTFLPYRMYYLAAQMSQAGYALPELLNEIGVMIHQYMSGAIETIGQHLFAQGHANSVGEPLAKRSSGGFHARGVSIFRMTRGFRTELAKIAEFIHGNIVAR